MNKTLFGIVLICLAACGGPQYCTVTLSGAQDGTYDCGPPALGWISPPNNTFNFAFNNLNQSAPPVISASFVIPGEPQVITYTEATTGAEGDVSVDRIAPNGTAMSWRAFMGGGNEVGSITLRFNNVSDPIVVGGGKGYNTFAGTVDAILPSQTGTGTAMTLHAMFRGVPSCSHGAYRTPGPCG